MYLNSPLGTSLAHVYNTSSGYLVDVIDPNEPGASTPFTVVASLGVRNFVVTATPVAAAPEPSSLLLLGSGAIALGALRRRIHRETSK
jgi:hypothetical protein